MTPYMRARLILAMMAMLGMTEVVSILSVAAVLEENWRKGETADLYYTVEDREYDITITPPKSDTDNNVAVAIKINGKTNDGLGRQWTRFLN